MDMTEELKNGMTDANTSVELKSVDEFSEETHRSVKSGREIVEEIREKFLNENGRFVTDDDWEEYAPWIQKIVEDEKKELAERVRRAKDKRREAAAAVDAVSCAKASEAFRKGRLMIAEDCNYSLDDYATKLNNNVLVVGGSGTGKTRTVVTPNLYQAVGSYVISDPKGNLYKKYRNYLRSKGYKVVKMDFTHPESSAKYNPMEYVRSTTDIFKLASILVNENNISRKDPYWDDSAKIYLSALVGYMIETDYQPKDFKSILELLSMGGRVDEENRNSSRIAEKFAMLKEADPESWACFQFDNANAAPDKTFDSTRVTLLTKFTGFDSEELREMMSGNDIDLTSPGREKTALFVIVSDSDRSMDGLVNLFFTQAIQALCCYADDECKDQRLPVPVRFILDDFATNCKIDEFPRIISSIRSRGISVMLMVQAEAQLEVGYGKNSSTIISNCDTYVYLGGNDVKTAEEISRRCNKPLGQVLNMPVGNCWVFRRGSQPVYTRLADPKRLIREMTEKIKESA